MQTYQIHWKCCTYKKHTSCKMNQLDRENEKVVGAWTSKCWLQNTMWIPDADKHIIFSVSLCGHFALGTFSKTYLKGVVFAVIVFIKQIVTKWQSPKVSNLTQNAKHVSWPNIWAQLTHIDICQIIVVWLFQTVLF